MDRILSAPLFKNSKRYPNLLRYVVERSLEGNTAHLKERDLGIEVFGRAPHYDTNLDPVVRTTAVEIRKRIAQYYHEPGHESEIRIEFPPGTYVPEFRLPQKPAVTAAPPMSQKRALTIAAAAIAALIVAALGLSRPWESKPALDRFWAPILDSPDPVLLYIGGYAIDAPQQPVSLTDLQNSEHIAYADATALTRITSLFSARHKSYRTRLQLSGKLEDLKEGPAVLIGGFNNSWTLRLTGQLRFGFARNLETHVSWIEDRENPKAMKWFHVMTAPYTSVQEDYAIISRVMDPTTGRMVVTASGLAKFGTEAAGEFLTNPIYMEQIPKQGPKDWDRRNIQLVIRSTVIGRSSGPPQIIAAHFW